MNEKDQKLSLSPRRRLELKKTVDAGQVRQSFSHGRSKVVAVEVRKKRSIQAHVSADQGGEVHTTEDVLQAADGGGDLTAREKASRMRALKEAQQKAEAETRRRAAEEEARRKTEEEEARRRQAAAEEEKRRKAEGSRQAMERNRVPGNMAVSARENSRPEGGRKPGEEKRAGEKDSTEVLRSRVLLEEEEEEGERKKGPRTPQTRQPAAKREARRRSAKLTVTSALDDDDRSQRGRSIAALRRAQEKERRKQILQQKSNEKVVREVVIPEAITVQELANRMAERGANVIKVLMRVGVMATINQSIDADTAELVVSEFGHMSKRVADADIEEGVLGPEDMADQLVPRAPVVTVMGHVDHGKTSLLDALRQTDVVSGEAGGITQHIGAYQVALPTGQHITFIDTPGHEAFTAMRARGAKVTDIVVLVVAADDGVMPQTIEAIRHARAAGVPVVVAINKLDRPEANPERVRNDLLQHGVVLESHGGDVLSVEVSAKKRFNLERLEEAVLLQAEILDLKANPDRSAIGTIIEARVEKGRGSVATVLVQRGTLKTGDVFVGGKEWGRVRALLDDRGQRVEQAGPAVPVEVLGFQAAPDAGDDFIVVEDEMRAREIASYRQRKQRETQQVQSGRGSLQEMFARIRTGDAKELAVVIKGDVQGSVEAITNTLGKLGTTGAKIRVLHAAVGSINESDVTLAKASQALIIGFNVRANPQAREMARRDGVDIRYYSVIYNVADDVRAVLSGMLEPTYREKFLGYAEIRQVFTISRVGKVAGCMVTEGLIRRGAKIRLLRDNVVVHEGNLLQLKRFKEDIREVRAGFDCGVCLENYHDIRDNDMVECYEMEKVATVL
ncbi:Translation initiation factor 2 [invertebrate metagenome]|uniref:Translation initiation factor 2 n=1 Tax=invertebrate metagenome TaxID=1711999 RepID=A0A484H745_9ZZZZ